MFFSIIYVDDYLISHAEANGYLGVAYFKSYRPTECLSAHLGYRLTLPDAHGFQATAQAVPAKDIYYSALLSRFHMT